MNMLCWLGTALPSRVWIGALVLTTGLAGAAAAEKVTEPLFEVKAASAQCQAAADAIGAVLKQVVADGGRIERGTGQRPWTVTLPAQLSRIEDLQASVAAAPCRIDGLSALNAESIRDFLNSRTIKSKKIPIADNLSRFELVFDDISAGATAQQPSGAGGSQSPTSSLSNANVAADSPPNPGEAAAKGQESGPPVTSGPVVISISTLQPAGCQEFTTTFIEVLNEFQKNGGTIRYDRNSGRWFVTSPATHASLFAEYGRRFSDATCSLRHRLKAFNPDTLADLLNSDEVAVVWSGGSDRQNRIDIAMIGDGLYTPGDLWQSIEAFVNARVDPRHVPAVAVSGVLASALCALAVLYLSIRLWWLKWSSARAKLRHKPQEALTDRMNSLVEVVAAVSLELQKITSFTRNDLPNLIKDNTEQIITEMLRRDPPPPPAALLEPAWQRARSAYAGPPTGFLTDFQRVISGVGDAESFRRKWKPEVVELINSEARQSSFTVAPQLYTMQGPQTETYFWLIDFDQNGKYLIPSPSMWKARVHYLRSDGIMMAVLFDGIFNRREGGEFSLLEPACVDVNGQAVHVLEPGVLIIPPQG
ncbi:hypothetical protein HL658_18645 [Azospirillum sp. RWY-5-1]|uniref:Uncharacterized protein n=1 Tax=Azospirillum oleiclasticum TaxID=2735135 RepID=A0ABX2TLS8_9PROT|nr:hypothetical protein [Azospirillum oleiclasticum]NYZ14573.1 hypothetical protein [Azospirillum oleiclasticum]NYZ24351.1 hypothetical protein [Azospirillum oleiclasticum]